MVEVNGHHDTIVKLADMALPKRRANAPSRAAYVLSGVIAVLMIASSALGLFVHDLYRDTAWGREAIRGGDLVTLVVVAPLLIAALIIAVRGSVRAQPVLLGLLVYSVYDYAYYVFGAVFNDVFLLHIALFSASVFALACALAGMDAEAIRDRLRADTAARWIGAMMAVVGALQGLLWGFLIVRYAMTGELLHDIPVAGQHLVFALDLGLLIPTLILAGILLFRRTAFGYMLGAAIALMAATYQLNLMAGGVFQANADVPGTKAFPPEGILLTAVFVVAAAILFWPRKQGRALESAERV